MKEKVKEFWEYNKLWISVGGLIICEAAALYFCGKRRGMETIANTVMRIANKTPELTFGDFQKQALDGTFDVAKYMVK